MIVNAIDILAGQRAALEAPASQRAPIYREQVMEPLRPLWEPMLAYAPQIAATGQDDLEMNVARSSGFYRLDESPEEGLAAIAMLDRAGSWKACQQAITDAERTLRPEEHGIRLERVTLGLVLASPQLASLLDRNYGYTGFGGRPGYVLVLVWPTDFNVPRLPSTVVHEFHHNVRLTFEPWTDATSVGQYVVLEGLAEAFAAELYGEDKLGPWADALSGSDLELARRRIGEALNVTGFDEIRGYIFGDWAAAEAGYTAHGLPDFTGYTVGYRLVRAYLNRVGRSAAEATYVPWREIVEESGYFSADTLNWNPLGA